jgi:hypothetical protein
MCQACVPSDPDPCGTAGYECGTTNDSCGDIQICGPCADPTDTCVDNLCEPSVAVPMFSCETISLNAPVCIDYLVSDGWTPTTAQESCDSFTTAGYSNQMVTGSCQSASVPKGGTAYETTWRCNGTVAKMGGIMYIYGSLFSWQTCQDYIGDLDSLPYDPDYDSGECEPSDPDPCATGGYVCGTVTDDCFNVHDCGSCSSDLVCSPDQTDCICGTWMCVYDNNNELPGDLYRPKQCDDLLGAGADEAAADDWCSTFQIGDLFPPFNPGITCGQCEAYMASATGRSGSAPAPIGGVCDITSDAAMPRNAYSENTQATPMLECEPTVLYTGAWACGAYGGVWTCYL